MKRHHLSLVDTKESPCGVDGRKPIQRSGQVMAPLGCQLPLPLGGDAESKKIVVVAMDHMHGAQFRSLILSLKPRTVIDLRHLIRFDLPGTSRAEIFSCFSRVHALYVNDSLPWHELQPRDFMTDGNSLSHRLSHEVIERDNSPIMLLASKVEDARLLASYLHRITSSSMKGAWVIEREV